MMRRGLLALSSSRSLRAAASSSGVGWRAASRFVAGETIEEAMTVVADINAAGMLMTLDHLGENVTSEAEAQHAREAYLEGARRIAAQGAQGNVSLKLTALGLDLGDEVALANLRAILAAASALSPPVFVNIDMEGSPYTARTLDIFAQVRADTPLVGTVIQSYLRRSPDDIERLIALGAAVRLVKGAYLEPPAVAFPDKSDVDAAYLRLAARLLSPEARARGVVAKIATHDETIVTWVKDLVTCESVPTGTFEFQMLYGIRRDLQAQLVAEGYRVRVYVPYGVEWYPYFMRRLAERPENVGFIVRNLMREGRG